MNPRPRRALARLQVGLILLGLAGCGGMAPEPPSLATGGEEWSASVADGPGLSAKLKFKDDAGAELFEIKPEPDGAKLVAPGGAELARYNRDGDKLKIKGKDDKPLAFIVGSKGKYHVKDASQATVLFELQRQADGDWKLQDGKEALLSKIKKRDYGFEIEDAREASLYKVKSKDGKISLRDAKDKTTLSTKDPASALGVACLGLDAVGDLPVRAGLLVSLALAGER